MSQQLWQASRSTDHARFQIYAKQIVNTIDSRMKAYEGFISAAAAYVSVVPKLDETTFEQFVNRLPLEENNPALQGLGFSVRLNADQVEAITAARRADGRPEFRVWPLPETGEVHSILYLEPRNPRNDAAVGFNMYSEAMRREAMDRARDTGEAAATRPVKLVQELEDGGQPGFLIYVPIYRGGRLPPTVEQRREQLIGFAYSPFRIHTMLNELVDPQALSLVGLQVFAGESADDGALVFGGRGAASGPARFSEDYSIEIAGQPWTLRVTSRPRLEATAAGQNAWFVFGAGLLTSLFLGFITWSQARARWQAERSAAEIFASQTALRESRERLRASLLASTTGTFRIDLRTREIEMDESLMRLFGLDEPPGDIGGVVTRIAPSDRGAFLAAVQATSAVTSELDVEFRVIRPDGRERWLVAKGRVDRSGSAPVLFGACTDLTQDKLNELDRRYSEARLRMALKAGHMGTWEFDFLRNEVRLSDSIEQLHGFDTRRSVRTIPELLERIHPEDRDLLTVKLARAQEDGGEQYIEYRSMGPDGAYRWIAARGEVIRDAGGRPLRMLGALMDITSRKRAEEHQRLLMAELNHRVKNTLATVLSIATQSLGRAATPREGLAAFQGRIESLAAIHGLLTDSMWEGADTREIARRIMAPYLRGDDPAVRLAGPSVQLSPKRALTLSLALHELATNAVKHGALSSPEGRVNLEWHVKADGHERQLELCWVERHGPPVESPDERGFGLRLLEQGLAYELSGSCTLDFQPEGLECRIVIPLRREDYAAGGRSLRPEEQHA